MSTDSKRDVVKIEFYNVPLDYDIDADIDKLMFDYEKHGIEVKPVDPNYDISSLIYAQKYVREHGLHAIFNINIALEDVIGKGTVVSEIILKARCVFECLPSWNNSKDLLIIDPYIFPKNYAPNYVDILCKLIECFTNIENITFITQKKHNLEIKKNILARLKSNGKRTKIIKSDDFHDRSWIISENEGVSFGTSINGLGKSHSIIMPLQPEDAAAIFALATTALQESPSS